MSRFLSDISSNKISIEEGLQRLLIIANKTGNVELSQWCNSELNGYKKFEELPPYRKFNGRNILYSGINGAYQVNNIPLGPGYLSEKTLAKIENIGIFENIVKVEENMASKDNMYRDLTPLSSEVYENTNDGLIGVSCTSIKQIIPNSYYSLVYSNVKTRIINLLCSYESAKVDIDSLDIRKEQITLIRQKNDEIYKVIVAEGSIYSFDSNKKKIVWNVIIPIIVGIIASVVSGVLVYLITKVWIS